MVSADLAKQVQVYHSIPGPTKEDSPDDDGWRILAYLPFRLLEEFTGEPSYPKKGTAWTANFYRCGGATDDQHACWSSIEVPEPDFHHPEAFGRIIFG